MTTERQKITEAIEFHKGRSGFGKFNTLLYAALKYRDSLPPDVERTPLDFALEALNDIAWDRVPKPKNRAYQALQEIGHAMVKAKE
jgi:hypothetical protein